MRSAIVTRRVELAGWAAVTVLALAAVGGWRRAVPRLPLDLPGALRPPDTIHVERNLNALAQLAERVIAHDPFRLDRRPSNVAYATDVDGMSAPTRPPRPSLRLAGILGGPPWRAVLDGLPGRDGSVVVRRGDVFDDLRVGMISRDAVIVTGLDTTWTLAIRRP